MTEKDLLEGKRKYNHNYNRIHVYLRRVKRLYFDVNSGNKTKEFNKINKIIRKRKFFKHLSNEERRLDKYCNDKKQ